jgi:hypothetical protein
MSWKSQDFPLQYQDFLHLKSGIPHLKSNFPHTESDLPISAFYFLQRLSAFFNGFLTFFNRFPLSPTAFQFPPTAFRFSSTAFHFPRNPRKSIYGKKYTKDRYLSFIFFATCSLSVVIPAKQYLRLTQHTPDKMSITLANRDIIRQFVHDVKREHMYAGGSGGH